MAGVLAAALREDHRADCQGRKGERDGKELLEPLELEDRGKELARQAAERVEKVGKSWIRDSKPAGHGLALDLHALAGGQADRHVARDGRRRHAGRP